MEKRITDQKKEESGNIKADVILEASMKLFAKKYGQKSLNEIMNFDTTYKNEMYNENHENLFQDENIQFVQFSELYEDLMKDNQKTQTGSFYTPRTIVDYMVERSLVRYLSYKTKLNEHLIKTSFSKKNNCLDITQIKKIIEALNNLKIIDIACGTGLFLVGCLEKIFKYKKMLLSTINTPISDFEIKKYVLEHNLYGIDIQEQPVILAKMILSSIVYYTHQEHYGTTLHHNIFVGDSLVDEELYQKDPIKNVLSENDGFDIVIGNPPYIGEKGNKVIFDKIKKTNFGSKFYEGKMDYFYFFIYKAIDLLNGDGFLSYITTNYFITADGANKLRRFLRNHCTFLEIINFNDYEIFKSAKGQHNMIFFVKNQFMEEQPVHVTYIKGGSRKAAEIRNILNDQERAVNNMVQYEIPSQSQIYDTNGNIVIQENYEYDKIIKKIQKNKEAVLHDICHINQGIVSGADKVTKEMLEKKLAERDIEKYGLFLGQGIFVINKTEAEMLGLMESMFLKPMYKNSDIQRYAAKKNTDRYILYLLDNSLINQSTKDEIYNHLIRFRSVLEKRRETEKGLRKWFALQWPRNQHLFEGMKIVVPHRAKINKFALVNFPWYASADVYFITERVASIDWFFLLGQLNSKIMYFWLYNRGKRKGYDLELYANPLKQLPLLVNMNNYSLKKIDSLVLSMIEKGEEDEAVQNCIDKILYEAYGLTKEEIDVIENLYNRISKEI